MNILDKIIAQKKIEVEQQKRTVSISQLRQSEFFGRSCSSLVESILKPGSSGIIAEHKRKSPSKGIINDQLRLETVVKGYEKAGAAGISVLTDEVFFGGSATDLLEARKWVQIPLLRKDFIIDAYQLYEAKAWGADVVLLIAANLDPLLLKELAEEAQELGLEVLMEVHNVQELEANLTAKVNLIGVNNRNLKDFSVGLSTSEHLAKHIPNGVVKVTESGLYTPADLDHLANFGYKGFLIGESFMRTPSPEAALREMIAGRTTML